MKVSDSSRCVVPWQRRDAARLACWNSHASSTRSSCPCAGLRLGPGTGLSVAGDVRARCCTMRAYVGPLGRDGAGLSPVIFAAGRGRCAAGRLLVIGGAEDRLRGSGVLQTFAELAGGAGERIVIITAALGIPGRSFANYSGAFQRFGVPAVRELRLARQGHADDERTLAALSWATGVFLSGGDQSRLGVLVGSRANVHVWRMGHAGVV